MLTAALLFAFQLPDAAPRPAVRFERDSPLDIVRFNRAEGVSLGWGGTFVIRESMMTVLVSARYAFGDERPQGRFAIRRQHDRGRLELAAVREMRDADPLAPGLGADNVIPALLLSHDDGEYVMTSGAELVSNQEIAGGIQMKTRIGYFHEEAPRATVRGGLTGRFQSRTPVDARSLLLMRYEWMTGDPDRLWLAGAEGSLTGAQYGRVWIGAEHRYEIGRGIDVALAGWAGAGNNTTPLHRQFRLGGARSLRGYDAGAFRGPAAFSASADLGAAQRVVSPVLFVDLGMTSRDDGPAASAGMGVSLLRGIARMHVAAPIARDSRLRFDLQFNARR